MASVASLSMIPAVSQHSNYLQYKKNTSILIRWVVTTAASCDCSVAPAAPKNNNPKNKKKVATAARRAQANVFSPEVTTTGLVLLSRAIAAAHQEVPSIIYALFEEVIRARKAAYAFWSDVCDDHPEKETIQRSNEGHLAFINALDSAFEALGGVIWRKGHQEEQEVRRKAREADRIKAVQAVANTTGPGVSLEFENKFAGLEVPTLSSQDEAEIEDLAKETESPAVTSATPEAVTATNQKEGKAKTNGRHGKITVQPLENYKIKSDAESYFSVCFFLKDFLKLSRYIRGIWLQVGLNKLHCAAAGALSNVATAMIVGLQYDLAMDFPECTYYGGIIRHLIRRGYSSIIENGVHGSAASNSRELAMKERDGIDLAEEQLLVCTEQDLVKFIEDYRKSRTGKPSSNYANINWNPNFSDRKMARSEVTPQKIRKWKSDFTISWLYDLVNTYAASRLQSNKPREKKPEKLEWKFTDLSSRQWTRRQLWGPVDLAYDITLLCMQKPGSAIASEIKPHHVFQLQIVVDSMLTAKRWNAQNVPPIECYGSTSSNLAWELGNSDLRAADALRDGWCHAADTLLQAMQGREDRHKDLEAWNHPLSYLPGVREDIETLGETSLAWNDKGPTSLFSNSSRNGLWLYSPYLCGTGIVEMLNTAYNWGTKMWERSGVMLAFFHLYNALLENGHLTERLESLEKLVKVFQEDVFGSHRPRLRDQRSCNFIHSFARAIGVKAEYLIGLSKGSNGGRRRKDHSYKESMTRQPGSSMEYGKFTKPGKLFALGQAGWMASRIDAKKFPSLSAAPPDAIGFLEAIKTEIVDDITSVIPPAYLNYNAILTMSMLFFKTLERKLQLRETVKKSETKDLSPDYELADRIMSLALCSDPVSRQDLEGTRLDSPTLARLGKEMEEFWIQDGEDVLSTCLHLDRAPEQIEEGTSGCKLGETASGQAFIAKRRMQALKRFEPELYEQFKRELENTKVGDCKDCPHCRAGVPIESDDPECPQM